MLQIVPSRKRRDGKCIIHVAEGNDATLSGFTEESLKVNSGVAEDGKVGHCPLPPKKPVMFCPQMKVYTIFDRLV